MKKESKKNHIPTFEEICQILDITALRQKEIAESQKETDRIVKETSLQMKETDRKMQETDRRIKAMQQEIGGISNSNGEFAEEYFYNVFEDDKLNFAGEHFDAIDRNIKVSDPKLNKRDEYDLILYNGENIAIIETKYKTRESNIENVIQKADSFRFWFPQYKNHKVYLGLAGLTFDTHTMQKARKKGIAIIRQRGGKTIVNDKDLKAY
jgi:hypothetical protein